MPAKFTTMLAQRLKDKTPHNVVEAVDGQVIANDKVLLAPGDFHMVASRNQAQMVVRLNQNERENSCRPAVDPLFRSVAKVCGRRALGVVLTGMGRDGAEGARALKASGARVVVQDQQSSVVWGMPGKVVECGCADAVMPPEEIGRTLAKVCKAPFPKKLSVR